MVATPTSCTARGTQRITELATGGGESHATDVSLIGRVQARSPRMSECVLAVPAQVPPPFGTKCATTPWNPVENISLSVSFRTHVAHVQMRSRQGACGDDDLPDVAEKHRVVKRTGQPDEGRNLIEGGIQAQGTGYGLHPHRGRVGRQFVALHNPAANVPLGPLAFSHGVTAEQVCIGQLGRQRHPPQPRTSEAAPAEGATRCCMSILTGGAPCARQPGASAEGPASIPGSPSGHAGEKGAIFQSEQSDY